MSNLWLIPHQSQSQPRPNREASHTRSRLLFEPAYGDGQAKPIISLGKTINVSFSLEASGELAPDATPDHQPWASNTAEPIRGYYLSPPTLQIAPSDAGGVLLSWDPGAVGMQLQRTFSLEDPDWQVVPGSTTTNQISWSSGTSNAFFRLAQP